MRLLGIDYGAKRIGVALSDEAAKFALPHSVLANSKDIVKGITAIASANGVKEVILGESRNYKGEANIILADSLELKKNLEEKGLTVHLELEFMTSTHASRFQGKNDLHDASAAALILQSFLDRRQNGKPAE